MDFASYVHQYYREGYLVYQDSGQVGKVCADSMNKTLSSDDVNGVLEKLGQSMCTTLEYKVSENVVIVKDKEPGVSYVDMVGPISDEKSFVTVPCHEQ